MAPRAVGRKGLSQVRTSPPPLKPCGIAIAPECRQASIIFGENVVTREDAQRARISYTNALDQIAAEAIDANVSLKLTHLGLDLGDDFCSGQLRIVTRRAAELGNFVRVDMEGSAYTDRTLEIVRQARSETDAVGTVIQAYLYRSEKDILDLLSVGCRIRLVKGAYKEPSQIAYPGKKQVDANFIKLMKILLPSGIYHAIATHDPDMIAATVQFAAENDILKDKFEFQTCSTAFARICRLGSHSRDIESAYTFRSGRIGSPTSCGGWRNVRRTCCFLRGMSFENESRIRPCARWFWSRHDTRSSFGIGLSRARRGPGAA